MKYTYELCPFCDTEVKVPAIKKAVAICPHCNHPILTCSMCDCDKENCNNCKAAKEVEK